MNLFCKISVYFFLFILCFNMDLYAQKYMAPVNIEIQKPAIKIADLHNNLDIVVYESMTNYFSGHQNLFNLIDRRDMEQIEEERSLFKNKTSGNFQSAAMLGTQIIIESTIKNVREKIDSACVEIQTPTKKVGNVQLYDSKMTECSLYIMTYSYNLELSAIDVETGSVIETISLSVSTQGSTKYVAGKRNKDDMRRDAMRRMHGCIRNVLNESSLFLTKINIPVLGVFKENVKKREAQELLVLGAHSTFVPYGLDMEVFEIIEDKIGSDVIKRQVLIGNGKFVSSTNGHFVLDVSKGKSEIFEKILANTSLYVRLGKNMINKTCTNTLN